MSRIGVDITVVAQCEEDLKSFVLLLGYIKRMGQVGACRKIEIVVDGDGSGSYDFLVNGERLDCSKLEDWDTPPIIYMGE